MIEKHFYKISGAVAGVGLVAVFFLASQDVKGLEINTYARQDDMAEERKGTLPKPDPLIFEQPMSESKPMCPITLDIYSSLASPKCVPDFYEPPSPQIWL